MSTKFGVIGGGVMGEALLSRLVAQQIYAPGEVLVSDPQAQRRNWLAQQYGVQVTDDNHAIASTAEVVLLAIKPQVFDAVVSGLTPSNPGQLVVSILAGVPLSKLEAAFPGQPVIRAMPNTPATIGAGMTAIAPGQHVTADHIKTAETLFQAVGDVAQVPESLMDAVTGLSGSGPAYVAILIEALADGGVAAGLPRAIALQLAIQTVRGTAELVQQSDLHPAVLKDRVTSPGGTTIAGVTQLEEHGFRAGLIAAVKAAAQRSKELGS
ncbi:pyrroline-5-carboxylate reductase [Oscillatoria sp. FACHB-1407]|nr:pyrroline-5-carboxylate reductase [Oscillatoria sp. FACHB-1407]